MFQSSNDESIYTRVSTTILESIKYPRTASRHNNVFLLFIFVGVLSGLCVGDGFGMTRRRSSRAFQDVFDCANKESKLFHHSAESWCTLDAEHPRTELYASKA